MNGGAAMTGMSGLPGAAGAASGPYRGWVVASICGVLPAALLTAAAAVPAALWSRLPGRIADHWTLVGTANGDAPRLVPFALIGIITLGGTGILWLGWGLIRGGARGGTPQRGRAVSGAATRTIVAGLFMTASGTACVIAMAVANLGSDGLRSASVGTGGVCELVGGPVVLAVASGYVLRRYGGLGAVDDGVPRPTVRLRAGERAVWTGRAHAGQTWVWGRPVSLLLVVGGVLAGVTTSRWGLDVLLTAIGVLFLLLTTARVTVSVRGVTVAYGVLGLRLTRIPLRKIASATAIEQAAAGFGYRGSLLLFGAAAVVLQHGPALLLTLRDGKMFLITVDDARTGAALLNDLIAAGHSPRADLGTS